MDSNPQLNFIVKSIQLSTCYFSLFRKINPCYPGTDKFFFFFQSCESMDYSFQPYQLTNNDRWRKHKQNRQDNYYIFSMLNFLFFLRKREHGTGKGKARLRICKQKSVVYEWTRRSTFCFQLVIESWHLVSVTCEIGDVKRQENITLSTINPSVNSRQHRYWMIFKWLTRSC